MKLKISFSGDSATVAILGGARVNMPAAEVRAKTVAELEALLAGRPAATFAVEAPEEDGE
jgi:hypothetical protein